MYVPSRVIPACGWGRAMSCTAKTTHAILNRCVLSSGHYTMVSLDTYQACSPAEDLQPSKGRNKQQQQQHVHRARKLTLLSHMLCCISHC